MCKTCSDENKMKRLQTVPEQFVAELVSNMGSHQGETAKKLNAVVKNLMEKPCGQKCAWCGQFLSFVRNKNVKTRFCQASVDKRTKLGLLHSSTAREQTSLRVLSVLLCLRCEHKIPLRGAEKIPRGCPSLHSNGGLQCNRLVG